MPRWLDPVSHAVTPSFCSGIITTESETAAPVRGHGCQPQKMCPNICQQNHAIKFRIDAECLAGRSFRRMTTRSPTSRLAGAGGIEPPNGGIKIHCLTAWLRPNRPVRKARDIVARALSRQRRSIGGVEPFQQATERILGRILPQIRSGNASLYNTPFITGLLPRNPGHLLQISMAFVPGAAQYRPRRVERTAVSWEYGNPLPFTLEARPWS